MVLPRDLCRERPAENISFAEVRDELRQLLPRWRAQRLEQLVRKLQKATGWKATRLLNQTGADPSSCGSERG